MKRTSILLALLFGAMLWFSPAGAQQKTRIAADQKVGVSMDKVSVLSVEQHKAVAKDLTTTDLFKKISANEMLKSLSRPVAKAGEETSTDPILTITNPAKDTVYSETNTPTFEFSAEGVVIGAQEGNAFFMVEIYEAPVTQTSQAVAYNNILSPTYTAPELPKGQYVIMVALGKIVDGKLDLWQTEGGSYIIKSVSFTIDYGDLVPNPVLTVLEPTQDTVFKETAFPLFKLALDPKGQNIEFAAAPGGAFILYTIFDEDDNTVESDYFFGLETHLQQPLEKGSYYAQFILGQVTSDYKVGSWPYTGEIPIFDYVEFTIDYEQPDPVLTVKNPAKDTTYKETRTPTFELELAHGEGVEFAAQPGYAAILYTVYSKDSLEKYPDNYDTAEVLAGYTLGLTTTLTTPLPKGNYEIEFILAQITNSYGFALWPYKGKEPIYAQADFTIDFAEPDPVFSMKNPAQDTVYAATNTPTFEVSVAHGEKLVWGEDPGNNAMMVQIYTEEAYNDPQGRPGVQSFVADTTFTVTKALPQGKYYGVFTLMTVSTEEGYYNYVNNLAGERIATEVGFTIAYGTTNDTMLVMKNPAQDTVYSETNTPTFEVSVINGENLVWGTTVGKNVVMMEVYTEEAYEKEEYPMIQEFLADTVFTISQQLPKGKYRATFNLMAVSEKAGSYYYINNAAGRVQANVNFTINYGDVRNPALILLNPAQDTVYAETTTPTFVLSLDKGGNDITLDYGEGNAAIMMEIFKAGATKALLEDFLVDTTYTLATADALDTGNYKVKFTLMQWTDETHLYYWPATELITTEVNIRVTCTEKPERMIVPTGLSTRTNQDTVWFSWISKEELYQLYVMDASGKKVLNVAVDADEKDSITTIQIPDFAEGSYSWQLRAVVIDEAGSILDYSDWSETKRFTVRYEDPEPPVSAVEDNFLAEVNVYPNPTVGEFKVSVPVDAMIEIYAANGHRVVTRTVAAGTETFALATSGIYFVRVTANGKTAVRRIVVR